MDNNLRGAYSVIDGDSPDLSLRFPPSSALPDRNTNGDGTSLDDDETSKSSISKTSRKSDRSVITRCCNGAFEDSWVLEVLAVLLSAASLAVMGGILYRFDGAQPPTWRHVSLNTVVAATSTVARACIGLFVSNALGQLKWIWFTSGTRRLVDISTFESASRGALGSAQLIWMQRSSHFATLGCVLVILLLGFDPFTQSLVNYPQKRVADSSQLAVLANNSIYNALGPLNTSSFDMAGSTAPDTYFVDPVLRANVYSSLFDLNPDQGWATPQYTCISGNCSWNAMMTLTAEYSCQNITNTITKRLKGDNQTVEVPNGVSLQSIDYPVYGIDESTTFFNISTSFTTVNFSETLGKIDPLVTVQYIFDQGFAVTASGYSNYVLDNSVSAMECVLFPCVRKISGSVSNNEYKETYGSFINNSTAWCEASTPKVWYENVLELGLEVGTGISPPTESDFSDTGTFNLSKTTESSLIYFLESVFNGYITSTEAGDQDYSTSVVTYGASSTDYSAKDVMQSIYYGAVPGCDIGKDHLECAMNNIAKALTKTFRDSPFIQNGTKGADMTVGDTLVERTFVRINWYWFIGPVAIWLAAVILWIGTTIKTSRRKVPVWRNNPLPLLFLYREGKIEEDAVGYSTSNAAYTNRASEIRVRLHANREHADLS